MAWQTKGRRSAFFPTVFRAMLRFGGGNLRIAGKLSVFPLSCCDMPWRRAGTQGLIADA
jgi:hypothetical protein